MTTARLYRGDALTVLRTLPDASVQCCVTSPPYWGLRDYGVDGQLGLEPTPEEYVANMVAVFREVRRVLRDDGTLWLNMGDCYAGGGRGGGGSFEAERSAWTTEKSKRTGARWGGGDSIVVGLSAKQLVGLPWRLAFALQADGWWLRADIVWAKPNPMPESVTDRPTKAHEYLFLLTKSGRYYYDAEAIAEPLESGTSDLRKMVEQGDRYGGKHLLDDPRLAANVNSRVGRKRAVGNADAAADALDAPADPAQATLEGIGDGGGRVRGRHSGNLERKWRGDHGGNPERQSHQAFGIPWASDGGGRNARSVWTIATQPYPGAHFATFPEELARRCILAGSSPKACDRCGSPWERIVERSGGSIGKSWHDHSADAEVGMTQSHGPGGAASGYESRNGEPPYQRRSVGWTPTCACEEAGTAVQTVLDPFGGSGTVAQVATGNGRAAVHIDLSPAYLDLAVQRIGPMLCEVVAQDAAASHLVGK